MSKINIKHNGVCVYYNTVTQTVKITDSSSSLNRQTDSSEKFVDAADDDTT